jgi:FtsH-binding integral membrane protein
MWLSRSNAMANDPKGPQKTIMGWGGQVPGQPQQPWQPPGQPAQPPQQQWPQPGAPVQPPQQQSPSPQQQWQAPQQQSPSPQQQWQAPQQQSPSPQQQWQAPQQQSPSPQQQWQPPGSPQQGWPQQPPMQPAWSQQPAQPAPQQQWQQPAMPQMPAMPAMGFPSAAASAPAPAYQQEATKGVSSRVRFIRLTYLHLFGAILAFVAFEYLLLTNTFLVTHISVPFVNFALGGRYNWGVVLAIFTGMSIATHWLAQHTTAKPLHYIGLVLYVIAEAVIFVPLMAIVMVKTADIVAHGGGNPNIIRDAAIITLGVFGALTATVVFTKKDFSFLRSALIVGGAAAMGLIVLSIVFGFNLGIVFAIAMVLLAAGQILYETSQIVAHEDPEAYVGAALSLFSSIALLFWYIIQIVMSLRE